MEKKRISVLRISSSIINFREKLLERFELKEWVWFEDRNKNLVFFGMYHWGDYIRFLWHQGIRSRDKIQQRTTIFWCGSDILNLKKCSIYLFPFFRKARNICENEVEKLELAKYGITAEIYPMCFEVFDEIKESYKHSDFPNVYLCCHSGYKEEYGVNYIEGLASVIPEVIFHIYGMYGISNNQNVIYHGVVTNELFNEEIKNYQAGLRLNDFDGFSEVLAKSILMGQWPISRISYPYIDYAKDTISLINLLKDLKNKKRPNTEGREYWYKQLKRNFL